MPRIREYYITLSACHNSIGLVFHFCRRGWLGPAAKGEGGGVPGGATVALLSTLESWTAS